MSEVTYRVTIDEERCTNCALCVAFCPVEVFEERSTSNPHITCHPGLDPGPTPAVAEPPQMSPIAPSSPSTPHIAHPELCWGCETCVGQCPEQAVHIAPESGVDPLENKATRPPLPAPQRELYAGWAAGLKQALGLRWEPVAVTLIPAGEPFPKLPLPQERLRYCQSLMAARRGRSFLMPANRHACPDGTAILGLTELPPKLASGELYKLFHKLDSVEAARHMVGERPHLPPRSIDATVVTPLAQAAVEPQLVVVFAQPEQVMWLCMSASYYTGHRFDFHASGYNAQCVETTLIPLTSGEPNISFGCYGCRASSDISDDIMFMGIPVQLMPTVIAGLQELSKKAIPQSRNKIYLPPL
ncbi:MAG: DUF169 domain-containing protein [Coriobacteriia bacterium]|nr:DUF169 domain-containing protein [Coriobacteriia bacterium]